MKIPLRTRRPAGALVACCLLPLLALACGKKGPPLAPLRLVPGPVSEVNARRSGDEVRLRFVVPTANVNGPGPVDIDHLEIYAITVGPGSPTPPNRELLTKVRAVGMIPVKPPPVEGEGEPDPNAKPDLRPAPGEVATFLEQLTPEKLQPVVLPVAAEDKTAAAAASPGVPPAPATPAAAVPDPTAAPGTPTAAPAPAAGAGTLPAQPPPPAGAAVPQPAPTGAGAAPAVGQTPGAPPRTAPAAAPATLPYPVRIYAVRGVSRGGRPGQPSTRIVLPLVDPPPVPGGVAASFTEKALVVEWTAPVSQPGQPPVVFNVYRPEPDTPPLNASPLATPKFEVAAPELGKEQCFVVRGVDVRQNVSLEGTASSTVCVTPQDIFPPATPQGVSILLLEGAIELVWDTNTEPDFGGYTVLRGEGPGETLRPLTPVPIRETTFRDANVKAGVRYVYAIVATDRTGNASPPSARVEGTPR